MEMDVMSLFPEDANDSFQPHWIAKLPEELYNKKINELKIPGSYESGAYSLMKTNQFVNENYYSHYCRDFLVMELGLDVVHNYSITQTKDIYNQLIMGIRYLDIQIALNPNDGRFYLVNFFYGPLLSNFFEQLMRFMSESPNEIIIIDIKHLHGMNDVQQIRLSNLFKRLFDERLYPKQNELPTVADFWKHHKQLIIYWPGPEVNHFWPRNHLVHLRPDRNTSVDLEMMLKRDIQKKHENNLLVAEVTFQLDLLYILKNKSKNVSTINIESRENMWHLLEAAKLNKDHLIHKSNVIMFDFIEQQVIGNYLVPIIINMNTKFSPIFSKSYNDV